MPTPPDPQTDSEKIYRAVITSNRGTIVMDLDPQLAPTTVNNFVGIFQPAQPHQPRGRLPP